MAVSVKQFVEVRGNESRMAGILRSTVDSARRAVEDVNRLKATLDQIAAGSDWATLATVLGWGNEPEDLARAEVVYNLVTAAEAALESDAVATLTSRIG